MGAGASSEAQAAIEKHSPEEITAYLKECKAEDVAKIKAALEGCATSPENYKVVKAETYFHPGCAFGAPKPDWMAKVDAFANDYTNAFKSVPSDTGALVALFTKDASWTDPVGGEDPPYVGTDAIKELLGKIPQVVSVNLQEVIYTPSPKIFLSGRIRKRLH
eukprot:TRINITY_DN9424_c0_g1_i7.p1 TRINITY_DN9424_c0_g1~~TRINITY_DN9424_c0_g1_i7.p1  ORF type:complete len:180 (-),score=30.24 TRINITY_DN9424_c0_g1_i7:557-1042(-)